MRSLVRRVAGAIALFWLVTTLTFALVRIAPGDAAALLISPSASAAEVARLHADLGLDASLPVQYARWLGAMLRGDLGESFAQRRPVTAVIADALPISIGLGAASLTLTFLIGVALGMVQASRERSRLDRVLTFATTAVYAAPAFWLSLAAIAIFTSGAARWGFPVWLRFPAFGVRDPAAEATGLAAIADVARHAVLPVGILSMIGAAGIARYARSTVADLVHADFVRTALAKGLTGGAVMRRHILANALPALVVLLALSLPGLVAGSVFVETMFAWPGMGRTMVNAISARDYPVVMGCTMLYGAMVIASNLLADVVVMRLDPRRAP